MQREGADKGSSGVNAPRVSASAPTMDVSSFEAFFEAEYLRLARALFLITGDLAESEDLAQEAMARIYERWDRVSAMASPVGYLYRTSLNLNRKRLRRLKVRSRREAADHRSPADPATVAEARSEIRRALSALPRGQREAIVLVEWMGLGAAEAGEVLGVEPTTVRARVSRAKAAIRQRLGGSDE
jgi:RNA polymerase sigma-70 factor (ECF subfamily)